MRETEAPPFRRDPPDLPVEFRGAGESQGVLEAGELISIEEAHLRDLARRELRIGALRIEGCLLERVQLTAGQFGSAVWKDVRFAGCDLANLRVHRLALSRVEFIDCRLAGLGASALDWHHVLVSNADLSYAQFSGGTFRDCEFENCNLEDADLEESDLRGCVLRSSKLARTDLRRAKLKNTDLRKSDVENLVVEMQDLAGAIVDPAQAMLFARLLGLTIS